MDIYADVAVVSSSAYWVRSTFGYWRDDSIDLGA